MDVDMVEEAEGTSRKIQVRFVTKLKPPFKVANSVISIPANLTRFGVSSVINSLLEATGDPDYKPEPFDILIDGELVRMSLEEFLAVKGISVEKILEIEYSKVVAPRKEEDPALHDDWVVTNKSKVFPKDNEAPPGGVDDMTNNFKESQVEDETLGSIVVRTHCS